MADERDGTLELSGKVCLVTGATSGIGKEIARGLARRGATTLVGGRTRESADAAVAEIASSTGSPNVEAAVGDLSSQADVRNLASEIEARHDRLDVLVNSAAVLVPDRRVTEDGIELILATNFLAPFLLTNLLADLLVRSAPSRVVNLVVPGWTKIKWDDLQGEHRFNMQRQNAQAKNALTMFTFELARRLEGTGVTANCVFPGFVDTGHDFPGSIGLIYKVGKPWVKTAPQGAEGPLFLASSPTLATVSGRYFSGTKQRKPASPTRSEFEWLRAWEKGVELTKPERTLPGTAEPRTPETPANGFEMENTMHFDHPREVVFDFLSDDRNEALWEPPNVSKIEKTSAGPVGLGTTFVGLYAPRDYEMHVKIVEYDRPRLVARETIGQVLTIGIHLEFAEENGGTRVTAKWQVTPKGFMRLLKPMLDRAFRTQLDKRNAQIEKGIAKKLAA